MLESVQKISDLNKYTDEEKRTEEYALLSEEVFKEYYKDVSEEYEAFVADVDKAVRNRDINAFMKIINDSYAAFQFLNDYLLLKAISDICQREIEAEEKTGFFELAEDLDSMVSLVRELKYLFCRIQFSGYGYDRQIVFFHFRLNDMGCDKKDVCEFIKTHGISRTALDYMISYCALDRFKMSLFLADAFMEESMLTYALYMYRKCNDIDEGREDVLVPMAKIYHICDRDAIALRCLDAITEPSDGIGELYEKYGQKVDADE